MRCNARRPAGHAIATGTTGSQAVSGVSVRCRTESFDTIDTSNFRYVYIVSKVFCPTSPAGIPCFYSGYERSVYHISNSCHRIRFLLSLLYRTLLSFGIQHNLVEGPSFSSSVHFKSLGSSSSSTAEGLAPPLLVDCHHRTFPPNTCSECWVGNWLGITPTTTIRVLTISTVITPTAIYNDRYFWLRADHDVYGGGAMMCLM